MNFTKAPDIETRLARIINKTDLNYIDIKRIKCFRSFGSTSKARARIWSFPKVWQLALKTKPHYVVEVISERFDSLTTSDQDKILIHELLHIPKNFSGALLPHRRRGRVISLAAVNKLYKIAFE